VRIAAFAAAFVLPFAVAALPLLSIAFSDGGSAASPERLAVTDVPASGFMEEQNQPTMAYGTSHATSSTGCDEALTTAIEG
jgi:hypothetical protein